jgi:peptidoglycan hydrolase-like protein with peptidoglycan-binding domain
MTTRGEINSNFYQIVFVDGNGNPTQVKPEYLANVPNANTANFANYANFAGNAFSVDVSNVVGIGNIATINLDGNVSNVLLGDGSFGPGGGGGGNTANANYANFAGNAFSVDGANVVGEVANAVVCKLCR